MAVLLIAHIHGVPLRSLPADSSEMVSQLRFGETAVELERQEKWVKIQCSADGYVGWADPKMLAVFTAEEAAKVLDWRFVFPQWVECRVRNNGRVEHLILGTGAMVPVMEENEVHALTILGGRRISIQVDALRKAAEPTAANVLEVSAQFRGAPYLWGGKTNWGADCSGFVQSVCAMAGIAMPRDAWQQAEKGQPRSFEEAQAGDLAYFSNDAGKITHVGLLLGDGEIRHAHGWVRDDHFRKEGIYNVQSDKLTHKLHVIQTMF